MAATANLEKGEVPRNAADAKGRFVKGAAGGKERAVDLGNRTVEGVASTINLDRDNEVILPSAFAGTLAKFLASNAPFLAAHTHRSWDAKPTQIGWVMAAEAAAEQVRCTFRFSTGEAAEQWWKLASDADGKGIAFSIGFIPTRWVYGSVADLIRAYPELAKPLRAAGLADDDKIRVYTEIELLEISAVPVPANREALQALAAKMADDANGEALEKFVDELAAKVAAKLTSEVAGSQESVASGGKERATGYRLRATDADAKDLGDLITSAIANIDELELRLTEQIEEIKCLLPDTLGTDAPAVNRTPPDDPATIAAKAKRAKQIMTAAVKLKRAAAGNSQ